MNYDKTNKRIRRVAILANGGDVAGLNPVIRAITKQLKTMESNVMDL